MLHHIENKTNERIPRIPFRKITDYTLGPHYELSLAFVDHKRSKELNRRYRHKNSEANILSFPFTKNEGEILIDIKTVKKEAAMLKEKNRSYLTYIFIHGLVHLKGFDHGSKMEGEEEGIRKKFSEK